jgi:hypothetical protein
VVLVALVVAVVLVVTVAAFRVNLLAVVLAQNQKLLFQPRQLSRSGVLVVTAFLLPLLQQAGVLARHRVKMVSLEVLAVAAVKVVVVVQRIIPVVLAKQTKVLKVVTQTFKTV